MISSGFLAKRIHGSVEVRFNVVTRNLHRVDSAAIHRAREKIGSSVWKENVP